MQSNYFASHAHSQFSTLDGMTTVQSMVDKVVKLGQPGMALTDHGTMGGVVKGYKTSQVAGIKFFPGFEGYLIDPDYGDWENPRKGDRVGRYHYGLLALTERGYKGLVKLVSLTHTRPRFNRFPRTTLGDLATFGRDYGEDVALTTGCYFGWVTQSLLRDEQEAARIVKVLASWFPNTFVELQNHNIFHEDTKNHDRFIVESLHRIAQQAGLPVLAGQDSHYCDQSQKPAHALMKRMTYGEGEDNEFPGDSFHLASSEWMHEHFEEQWDDIEDGHGRLLELHDVRIEPLDKFVIDVPSLKGVLNPRKRLHGLVERALTEYLDGKGVEPESKEEQAYYDRALHELDTIDHLKMWTYFLIWVTFVRWCRDEHIAIEARGSANGSLVCFLLGITQIDPIQWGTMFERFLSKDRLKPPDVDMDIEDAERPRAVAYLLSLFDSAQIGTYAKLGSSINEDGEETGSVLVSWLSGKRRECQAIASQRVEKKGEADTYARNLFNKRYGHVKAMRDVGTVSQRDLSGLRTLASMNSVYRSYGVHPGGVLLSGDRVKIDDYIPTMLVASSNTRVTMYDMHDVEEFGLLKMDVLGQATLRTMRIAQELIGRDNPTDFGWIEDDDREACKILREGRVDNGVFHFEGYTKAKGGRELGIKNTKDAVLAQALYMPGAMETGQTEHYVRCRKDARARREVEYIHPIFEHVLKETYGAVVFQEQVIDIMRGLGMDIAGINTFFKVVKDSGKGATQRNTERMNEVKKQFARLCKKNGIRDVEAAWQQTAGFVSYGFNRNHATGYGVRAYRCAYLKAHYPLEFMTALLQTWAGRKKEAKYIREARRLGIRILPPLVNVSGVSWSIDRQHGAIRKGLTSIPGIGDTTAVQIAEAGPYESLEDMIERLPARVMTGGKNYLEDGRITGTIAKLNDVGALDSLLEG